MKKIILTVVIIIMLVAIGVFSYNTLYSESPKEEKTTKDTLPEKNEPYKNKKNIKSDYTDDEKEIELKYDQYITASGYAGAADNVYYTRNGVLYHLVVSTEQTTRVAEGIDKIESDLDCLRAHKSKNFKIITDDEYVVYYD